MPFLPVCVGGVGGDGFDAAGCGAVLPCSADDEVEDVCRVAVGEGAGLFYASFCGIAMPCVDVVHGVVGHEQQLPAACGVGYVAVGFLGYGAACDAACRCGDVVGEDGEVAAGVAVLLVVVGVVVDAPAAAFAVEDAAVCGDGGDAGGASVAVVEDFGVGGGEGCPVVGFEYPFRIHGAEHDDVGMGEHPADGGLGLGLHGEEHSVIVQFACGEVGQVVCAGEPEGLRLFARGGEDEAALVQGGYAGVAVAGVEGGGRPVVGAERGAEGEAYGGVVFEEAVCEGAQLHVVAVGKDDELVAADVGHPSGGGGVPVDLAHGVEGEAQVAFFLLFVACDDVVGGGADAAAAFSHVFPWFRCGSAAVVAFDGVGAVPGAGAVELPLAAAG